MAKKVIPLTDTKIKQAKGKVKEYNLTDGDGLALRVLPTGKKYWLFNYTKPFTKQRSNISFGTYPQVSLLSARKLREAARELIAQDIDPKEHRDNISNNEILALKNTFEVVARLWMDKKQQNLEPETAKDHWRSLELHIFPIMGKKPIHKVTAQLAIKTLEPIAAKGNLETIKRLSGRLNEVMDFAVNIGLINNNPLRGIRKAFGTPQKEHYPTLKPNQLSELMHALSVASINLCTRCLIEWQLHTMSRPSEAAGTRWAEIDFENKLWHLPADRMKKRRAHTVPLSNQSIALLERMKTISGNREFVFPGDRNPRNHINAQTANMALKRMGFEGILVAHGLRALASTTLNEQGFDSDVIEAALAHTDKNEVRAAYNRADYLERRKSLMSWWSEHIESAAMGSTSLASINNIVSIRTAGN